MPGFGRHERIRKRGEYLALSSSGRKAYSPHFVVLWHRSSLDRPRIGLTVSRKVGTAVVRNRIKRRLREFFRNNKELFPTADFNIIARQGADRLDLKGLSEELRKVLQRIPTSKC